jgi:predicted secreted protein
MTSGVVGFGTQVKLGAGTGTSIVYTAISEIIGDISGPSLELSTVEATNHGSASNYREYLAGLVEPGEISFKINYISGNTQHEALQTALTTRAVSLFRVEWPDGDEVGFSGLVTKFAKAAPMEDMLAMDVTIKITGPIVDVP